MSQTATKRTTDSLNNPKLKAVKLQHCYQSYQSSSSGLTYEEELIWDIIRKNAKGKKNAISYKTISEITGMNSRYVRAVVKDLVEKHNLPICSSYDPWRGGYYIPTSKEEVEEAYRYLLSHAVHLMNRARAVKKFGETQIKKEEREKNSTGEAKNHEFKQTPLFAFSVRGSSM